MKIPLTGTTGFAGQALIEHLLFNSCEARVLLRDSSAVVQLSKFLRKTKINEYPQLLNIFFGDRSIVEPGPLTIQFYK